MVAERLDVHIWRMKLDLYLNPIQKLTPVDSKWTEPHTIYVKEQTSWTGLHFPKNKDNDQPVGLHQSKKLVVQLGKQLTQEEAHTVISARYTSAEDSFLEHIKNSKNPT